MALLNDDVYSDEQYKSYNNRGSSVHLLNYSPR